MYPSGFARSLGPIVPSFMLGLTLPILVEPEAEIFDQSQTPKRTTQIATQKPEIRSPTLKETPGRKPNVSINYASSSRLQASNPVLD